MPLITPCPQFWQKVTTTRIGPSEEACHQELIQEALGDTRDADDVWHTLDLSMHPVLRFLRLSLMPDQIRTCNDPNDLPRPILNEHSWELLDQHDH